MKKLKRIDSIIPLVLEYLQNKYDLEAVMVTGSIIEGIGNSNSDFDIFVIAELDNSRKIEIIRDINFEMMTLDFVIYDRLFLRDMFRRLKEKPSELEKYDYDFLHRLKYAVEIYSPLINIDYHQSVSFSRFDYSLALRYSTSGTKQLKNANASLTEEDYGSAFFILRDVLQNLMLAYMSIHGETNPNKKWFYKKLEKVRKKTKDHTLIDEFIRIISMPFEGKESSFTDEAQEFIFLLQHEIMIEMKKMEGFENVEFNG